jgi:hypothetical protein
MRVCDFRPNLLLDGVLGLRAVDHHEALGHALRQDQIAFAHLAMKIEVLAFHPIR